MLKKWIRKWLAIEATPSVVAEILPPAKTPTPGFFSTAPMRRSGAQPGESLEKYLTRTSGQVFQRGPVRAVEMAVGATDGAIAFVEGTALDDGGDYIKSQFGYSGGVMPDAQIDWYAAQSFIGYQMCAILAQHWFVDKACSMPPRDAIRNGYNITRDDGEKLDPAMVDEYKKYDKKFKIRANCVEAVRKMKMFGIRVVLFEVESDDPDYYAKPFNPDGIKPGSYKGMSQIDPYWVTPELNSTAAADPSSKHFYEPTWWRIGSKRYHRSHLVILRTCDVPDVLKPTYYFGGVPLPQRIYERVYAAERTANEAPQLALTKRSTYIHVDLEAAAANQSGLVDKLTFWRYMLDNFGVKVLGKEETAEQFDTNLSNFDETIMTQFQLCCSIADVPATKMLGTQPKGFNATGEYEEANYHESLESIQEMDMGPLIDRHNLLVTRAYICPKFKCEPFELGVVFEDLDAETAGEKAERMGKEAEADAKWSAAGAIDGIDIRGRLIKDKDGPYTGIEAAAPEPPPVAFDPLAPPGAPGSAPPGQQPPKPGQPPAARPATPPAFGKPPGQAHDELEAIFNGLSAWVHAAATH